MSARREITTGTKFGRLMVLWMVEREGRSQFLCACDCGRTTVKRGNSLLRGLIRSCGCLRAEQIGALRRTYGATKTKTYKIWNGMHARCEVASATKYEAYGGRGIKVCERWRSYEAFLEDMGECQPGYSIERRDVDGDYEPSNCLWIPLRDQQKNTRRTKNATQRKMVCEQA